MARPRTPLAVAAVEGADKKNPQRFRNRAEPQVDDDLGDAPEWIVDTEHSKARSAWKMFARELPWLNSSHRAHVGMAAVIQGRLMAGDLPGIQALNLLRQLIGQMGGNPADASKVTMPDDGEEPDDILD